MDQNPDNPTDTVSGAHDVSAAEGDVNDGLSLDAINQLVGREYKTLEDAQKGLKETYSYVGDAPKLKAELEETQAKLAELTQPKKGKADEVQELTETVKNLQKQNEINDWYQANPEYIPHKAVISKLGDNPADVIADESNQPILNAVLGQSNDTPNTVMDSNSQPNPSSSYDDDFKKAKETGDFASLVMKHHIPEEAG